jgi:hypothetical protein
MGKFIGEWTPTPPRQTMGDDKFFKCSSENPHGIGFSDKAKAEYEAIAALLELDDWTDAINFGRHLAMDCAKARAKGLTHVYFLAPEEAAIITNNTEFFRALCEDGVIEWLTPLVLRREAREEPKPDV